MFYVPDCLTRNCTRKVTKSTFVAIRIIRKGTERVDSSTERVDSSMDEDAGKQAAAAIKDRDQQEADWQERAVCKVHTVSASCSFG